MSSQIASSSYTAKLALGRSITRNRCPYVAFYKHVKHSGGLNEYLSRCFVNHFETALADMWVNDAEINALFVEKAQINEPGSLWRNPLK